MRNSIIILVIAAFLFLQGFGAFAFAGGCCLKGQCQCASGTCCVNGKCSCPGNTCCAAGQCKCADGTACKSCKCS